MTVRTPCIGICSTTYGDVVCRGCKRFAHEIIDWNRYSDIQKRLVLLRLREVHRSVVAARVEVTDSSLLAEQLDKHRVPRQDDADPLIWFFDLLRRGARKMRDLEAYGVRARSGFVDRSPVELLEELDAEFFERSEAHYRRYFALGPVDAGPVDSGPVDSGPVDSGAEAD